MNDVATHHRVELRGFEPLAPCMPCRCATNCATAPRAVSAWEPGFSLPGPLPITKTGPTSAASWHAQGINLLLSLTRLPHVCAQLQSVSLALCRKRTRLN